MMDPSYDYEIEDHSLQKTIKIEDCDYNGEELMDPYILESIGTGVKVNIFDESAVKAEGVIIHGNSSLKVDDQNPELCERDRICEDPNDKAVDLVPDIKIFDDNVEEGVPITDPIPSDNHFTTEEISFAHDDEEPCSNAPAKADKMLNDESKDIGNRVVLNQYRRKKTGPNKNLKKNEASDKGGHKTGRINLKVTKKDSPIKKKLKEMEPKKSQKVGKQELLPDSLRNESHFLF